MGLEIKLPGAFTSIQDKGRRGYLSQGFIESGACDKYSMAVANLFAGNLSEPELAVMEFTLKGGEITFTSDEVIALTGADMNPLKNGVPIPMYRPVVMKEGDSLSLGIASKGLRTYLAVYGGVAVLPVLGSRSTDIKSCLGGLDGRALKAGDVLQSGKSGEEIKRFAAAVYEMDFTSLAGENESWFINPSNPFRYSADKRYVLLRTVPGPQAEAFTEEGRNTFVRNPYQLTVDCDRMACRLNGPPIEFGKGGGYYFRCSHGRIGSDHLFGTSHCHAGRSSDHRRVCKDCHCYQYGYSRTGSAASGGLGDFSVRNCHGSGEDCKERE